MTGKLDVREAAARLERAYPEYGEPRSVSVEEPMEAPEEIIFEITEAPEGASMLDLWATASSRRGGLADLKAMVGDAVRCHFGDGDEPRVVRRHFVQDEAIAV